MLTVSCRWLRGPRRYGELMDNLEGMGTNLLATRLREMKQSGFVDIEDRHYRLTEAGRSLAPVVHALVRFGLSLEVEPESAHLSRPEWDCVALRALFKPELAEGLAGQYALILDGHSYSLTVTDDELAVSLGVPEDPRCIVELDKKTAAGLTAGELSLSDAIAREQVEFRGNRSEARRLLKAFIG